MIKTLCKIQLGFACIVQYAHFFKYQQCFTVNIARVQQDRVHLFMIFNNI